MAISYVSENAMFRRIPELRMSKNNVTGLHARPSPGQNGEADHRVANSLAAISGLVRVRARSADVLADPKTFLLEIADRIDTVARLHRLLARSNNENVRLAEYLQEICDKLASALATNRPEYAVDCSPERILPYNVALPLGLITAELFSNSLKYAHPTGLPVTISVSCSQTPTGELLFSYDDDGVGFPEAFDVSQDGHLGMQFIRSLSGQLGATHKWHSDPLGIQFQMQVPFRDMKHSG
jgi:two-component sensor histidine kinase